MGKKSRRKGCSKHELIVNLEARQLPPNVVRIRIDRMAAVDAALLDALICSCRVCGECEERERATGP